jgi:hypothetical protein
MSRTLFSLPTNPRLKRSIITFSRSSLTLFEGGIDWSRENLARGCIPSSEEQFKRNRRKIAEKKRKR